MEEQRWRQRLREVNAIRRNRVVRPRTAEEEGRLLRRFRILQAILTTQEERAAMVGPWEPPPPSELDLELQVQILQAKVDSLEGERPVSPRIQKL